MKREGRQYYSATEIVAIECSKKNIYLVIINNDINIYNFTYLSIDLISIRRTILLAKCRAELSF